MKLAYTRAMVNAALDGKLAEVEFVEDPVFGVQVPTSCPNVPSEVLSPRGTWADKDAYDVQAKKLAGMFVENFKQYADKTSDSVKAAGPKV
jgi:phosphoenolpyruvate carboxykinase (ATP)